MVTNEQAHKSFKRFLKLNFSGYIVCLWTSLLLFSALCRHHCWRLGERTEIAFIWWENTDFGSERMHLVSNNVSACCVSNQIQTMLSRYGGIQYCAMKSFCACHYTSISKDQSMIYTLLPPRRKTIIYWTDIVFSFFFFFLLMMPILHFNLLIVDEDKTLHWFSLLWVIFLNCICPDIVSYNVNLYILFVCWFKNPSCTPLILITHGFSSSASVINFR